MWGSPFSLLSDILVLGSLHSWISEVSELRVKSTMRGVVRLRLKEKVLWGPKRPDLRSFRQGSLYWGDRDSFFFSKKEDFVFSNRSGRV